MRGDPGDVQSAGAVYQEHQRIYPAQVDQVDVDEVAGDDALSLLAEELAPVGPLRRGAGSRPAAVRISHTVVAPMRCPRRTSSPWMRRQPQRGFSSASRSASALTALAVGGLAGLRRRML
jgi:hypothetical protein